MRRLYYGDNLPVLREMPDESVDLIYLDPPFSSERAYNVIYPEDLGQVQVFEDIWSWGTHCDITLEEHGAGMDMLRALVDGMGKIQIAAYLVMMTPRLAELHRILKPTGSLYLHCDPTASHYLKVIMDAIFGRGNFRNEVTWRRTGSHGNAKRWGPIHDTLLFYTKSEPYTWNGPRHSYMNGHVKQHLARDEDGYRTKYYGNVLTGSGVRNGLSGQPWMGIDPTAKGRHWAIPGRLWEESGIDGTGLNQRQKLDALYAAGFIRLEDGDVWPIYEHRVDPTQGPAVGDVWAYQPYTEGTVFGSKKGIDNDISWIKPRAKERLGFNTQKPIGLLERIIRASSNPGDIVCDPFCGCGTSVAAAENLGRQWIGIDITYAAIAAIHERFRRDRVDIWKDVGIVNRPETVQEVDDRLLNTQSPLHPRKEFEKFCVASIGGLPNEKMGADGGVDGRIQLLLKKRANVSVKSGNVGVGDIRDLRGTLNDKKDVGGVFVTRQPATRSMRKLVDTSGVVKLELLPPFPKMQILTLDEILNGKRPVLPYAYAA